VDEQVVVPPTERIDALMNPEGLYPEAQRRGQAADNFAVFECLDFCFGHAAKFGVDLDLGAQTVIVGGLKEVGIVPYEAVCSAIEHQALATPGVDGIQKCRRIRSRDDIRIDKDRAKKRRLGACRRRPQVGDLERQQC